MRTTLRSDPAVTALIASNVRAVMKSNRWSGRALAVELGWPPANMSRRLAGLTDFTAPELARVAQRPTRLVH